MSWIFEIYTDQSGEHRWRLRAANGEIVADSAEGYTRRDDAHEAVKRLRIEAAGAIVLDGSEIGD